MSSRWKKVWGDFWGNKGRTVLTIITIAVGTFAVGFNDSMANYMLESMDGDYLSANPSEAMVYTSRIDEDYVELARKVPGVNAVEGRSTAGGNVIKEGADPLTIQFTAIEDPANLTLNQLKPVPGESVLPPLGDREVLVDASAQAAGYKPGDTLIVGVGARTGGYLAESGCTFVVGEPSADQMRCLEATWACDQAAVDALRPGATCSSVNDAALAVLRDRGYADHIRHRIGHGIGIQAHEAPWLSTGDNTLLEPSMVFSNEPGIYRPGLDGYRIIDTMVVTSKGGRRLSKYLSEHGPHDRVIPI